MAQVPSDAKELPGGQKQWTDSQGRTVTWTPEPPAKAYSPEGHALIGSGWIGTPNENLYVQQQQYAGRSSADIQADIAATKADIIESPAALPMSEAQKQNIAREVAQSGSKFIARDAGGAAHLFKTASERDAFIERRNIQTEQMRTGTGAFRGYAPMTRDAASLEIAEAGEVNLTPYSSVMNIKTGGFDFSFGLSPGVTEKIRGRDLPITITPGFSDFLTVQRRKAGITPQDIQAEIDKAFFDAASLPVALGWSDIQMAINASPPPKRKTNAVPIASSSATKTPFGSVITPAGDVQSISELRIASQKYKDMPFVERGLWGERTLFNGFNLHKYCGWCFRRRIKTKQFHFFRLAHTAYLEKMRR